MKPLGAFLRTCKIRPGRTLIVGSKIHEGTDKPDRRKLYPGSIGVDLEHGFGVDVVADLEEELPHGLGRFDHIECTSVLEHSPRPWLLCANLQRLLVDGGTILIAVPWVWRVHNYPGDYFRFTEQGIAAMLPEIEWEQQRFIVEDEVVKMVPRLEKNGVRYLARSELVMFGRKCSSTS